LVENQALALRGFVVDNAFTDVQKLVQTAVTRDADIVYGVFLNADGSPWAYTSPTTQPIVDNTDASSAIAKANLEKWVELGLPASSGKNKSATEGMSRQFGQEVLEVSRPVMDGEEVLGVIRYGLSTAPLHRALSHAQAESAHALRVTLTWLSSVVLFCTLLGFVLVSRAATRIVQPLMELKSATDRIASGEVGVRVNTNDELQALAFAFNHMQQSNEDTMKRLHDAMEAALEASRLKGEFLANMSHEIRTPMNGVIGMIRLILKMPLEGKLRRYAETVDTSASALMTIINDVLDFSKMEAGKYTLQNVPFDAALVLQEVAELQSGRAYDKALELVYRKAANVPQIVSGDPDRYRQILNNLVGNAIKFTDQGEVFVELTLDSEDDEAYVLRTVVQDTGRGINKEDQSKLFSAFSQVDGSMVREHGGTGLGLAISKRLTDMMNGEIGLISDRGVGSKFWFTIRVERSQAPVRAALSSLPNGRRAIVVEASRRWSRIIEEHLLAWGLQCEVFQDGKPALAALKAAVGPRAFDIAVVGAQLRDVNIESFVRELRQIPTAQQLPLIVLTQLGAAATLSEVEKEVAAQISKPLRLSELYDCIVGTFAGTGLPMQQPRAKTRSVKNRGKRILVVDDNDINQFVATEQIEALGFAADVASNGAEAVAAVKANQYAMVLMDCQMPVMDGYTAARTIREWEGNQRHLPIIALTAHAMAGERDKVLAAGMDDYLSKPLRTHSLERMLDRYLGDDVPANDVMPQEEATGPKLELDTSLELSPKLVDLFISRVPDNLSELDASVKIKDAKRIREKAHKLKGSCLAVGAEAMAYEAELLQNESEQGHLELAEQRAKTLWEQYDRVCILLKGPSEQMTAE
jgi:signal transduction histidine kinase/CheY-like chemotaxis protein/HPt (histidine-containing phosphotransfer) domain-containing protein